MFVGQDAEAPQKQAGDRIIDCEGTIVMPGLVNAHTHTGMTCMRNLLEDVNSTTWFQREQQAEAMLDKDDFYWAAKVGAYEMLRQGVTTCADRFSFMDILAKGLEDTGIRAVLGESIVDADADRRKGITVSLLEKFGTDPAQSLLSVGIAPVGPDSSGSDLLTWCGQVAEDYQASIFLHVAQSQQEQAVVRKRGYRNSVQYLKELGLLSERLVAAHCIYVDDEDIELLAEQGVRVAHCPASNIKIEGRTIDLCHYLDQGITVGLGTDCATSNNAMDMFEEMKTAGLAQKQKHQNPELMPVSQLIELATIGSARCLGMDEIVGSLEVGKRADVIMLQHDAVHLQPWHSVLAGLVYAARGLDVSAVWVNGVQRVEGGQLLDDGYREALCHAQKWQEKLSGINN